MIRQLFNRVVAVSGYEIRRRHGSDIHDLRIPGYSPTPSEGAYLGESSRYIVDVPAEMVGRTPLMRLWVAILQDYVAQGEDAARQRLQAYFDTYEPKSVADLLQIKPSQPWHHGNPLSYVYPWDAEGPEEKVAFRVELMRKEAKEHGFHMWKESDGWKGFGPVSSAVVDMELRRLINTCESIRTHGFDERRGQVQGRIYGWGPSEMVLPRRGWHRVAVCLALDMEKIPMLFDRRHAIIRHEDAARWPNVVNGNFTVNDAYSIFERRFLMTRSPSCKVTLGISFPGRSNSLFGQSLTS
ncbi:hypothetical protein ACM26W_15845 [Halomonas sp. HK25]|uniref:hypothetical protein n=1 Tax=Halomonas sp. HK25 TaxID=3394321 RepID=UPI0039FD731F